MTDHPPPHDLPPLPPAGETPFPAPDADDRADGGPAIPRRVVLPGAALLGAFLIGLLVGWQVLGGDDEDAPSASGSNTAELACSAFEEVDVDDFFAEEADPLDDGTLFLVQGATGLGQAAGADSDEYAELAEQSELVHQSLQRFDRAGAIEAGEAVAAECAELFPS